MMYIYWLVTYNSQNLLQISRQDIIWIDTRRKQNCPPFLYQL